MLCKEMLLNNQKENNTFKMNGSQNNCAKKKPNNKEYKLYDLI